MTCQCKYFFNLWFRITNRLAYYGGIADSPCSSECAKAVAKQYAAVLEFQLAKVEKILVDLKCPGFDNVTDIKAIIKGAK